MSVDFIDIKDYIQSRDDNIVIKNFWYSIITGLFIVLIILVSLLIKIKNNYQGILYFAKDEIYTYVEYSSINHILKCNNLIIDNQKYAYNFLDLVYDNNQEKYKVILDIDLKNKYLLSQNVNYKILINETNLLEYVIKNIK